jgi:probable F420-dependent oxidoreductase
MVWNADTDEDYCAGYAAGAMKVDAGGYPASVDAAAKEAVRAEAAGYDGFWAPETQLDALIACAVAAERTSQIELSTAITVAFGRSPMTVALQANDVQSLSGGRFSVKPHITKRYSMPWSHPAPRMREFVLAVRAIWKAWETGEKLDFRGDFYTHTLMTPFFNPGPNQFGNPGVLVAGVGPLMTEVAGEVADGLLCHAFSTERYLREVTLPALERGRAKVGLGLDGFEISGPSFIVARTDPDELVAGAQFVRGQIGFYGSTPAYRPVLDLHGWGSLGDELNAMTKRGEWDKLADAIDDEVLGTFAVIGTPAEVVEELKRRYGGIVTRLTVSLPDDQTDAAALLKGLRAA